MRNSGVDDLAAVQQEWGSRGRRDVGEPQIESYRCGRDWEWSIRVRCFLFGSIFWRKKRPKRVIPDLISCNTLIFQLLEKIEKISARCCGDWRRLSGSVVCERSQEAKAWCPDCDLWSTERSLWLLHGSGKIVSNNICCLKNRMDSLQWYPGDGDTTGNGMWWFLIQGTKKARKKSGFFPFDVEFGAVMPAGEETLVS